MCGKCLLKRQPRMTQLKGDVLRLPDLKQKTEFLTRFTDIAASQVNVLQIEIPLPSTEIMFLTNGQSSSVQWCVLVIQPLLGRFLIQHL